jgi:hypothetical protein
MRAYVCIDLDQIYDIPIYDVLIYDRIPGTQGFLQCVTEVRKVLYT